MDARDYLHNKGIKPYQNIKVRTWENGDQLHSLRKLLEDYKEKQLKLHIVSQQRELLIAYETWKTENDIKNLLPEQLADFYIESN